MPVCPTCGHDDGARQAQPIKHGMSRYKNTKGDEIAFNSVDEKVSIKGVEWVRIDKWVAPSALKAPAEPLKK